MTPSESTVSQSFNYFLEFQKYIPVSGKYVQFTTPNLEFDTPSRTIYMSGDIYKYNNLLLK